MKAQLKKKIIPLISQSIHLDHFQVFLFGSQATGEAHERSDYDIGILAKEQVPLEQIHELRYLLNEKIPLLNTFEVVDFKRTSTDFKELALKTSEILYEQ